MDVAADGDLNVAGVVAFGWLMVAAFVIARALAGASLDKTSRIHALSPELVALIVDDLGVVLKVVGATGSTIVSYILPGSCYFLLYREPHTLRWAALALLVAGAVIMPLSLTLIFLPA